METMSLTIAARYENTGLYVDQDAEASKKERGRILDEVVSVTGWSRDNAWRRLTGSVKERAVRAGPRPRGRSPSRERNPRDDPLLQGWRARGAGYPEPREKEMKMGYWYHPEIEEHTIGAVMDYTDKHRDEILKIEFADGESYIATFFAAYESENTGELDIEENDPRYDQFYVVTFVITKILQDGTRRYNDSLSLDYRDFPTRITNADTGHIIYQS